MTGTSLEAHRDNLDRPVSELAHVDYMQLFDWETVGESLERIRGEHLGERVVYFYAIGKGDKLVGVVPARRLIIHTQETLIRDILISPAVSIPEHATLREAFGIMAGRKLLAVPLVDSHNRISGVIDVRHYTVEAVDLERREEADRMFQLLGFHVESADHGMWPAFRSRFPWMLCNIASGLAAAAITGAYSGLLKHTVALAFFFSVVLGIAESVSMQSVSIGLQSLDRQIRTWHEIRMGPILGLAAGLTVGLVGWTAIGLPLIGIILAASILFGASTGAVLGLHLPRLVHRWKLDPKIASGPAVLALTDIVTLTAYLSLATWILRE
ncbi:MAG TPA: magnesium transporter [Bryobacteraceae bacterium]|jgi:magnesium transporter